MSDEYAKHSELDMPVALIERLKQQSIYSFLKQAQEIANEPLFPKWLGYRSGNSTAIREPSERYSGRFVNIGGTAPWVGGEKVEKKPYENFFPPLGTLDQTVDEISKELDDAVSTMAQGPVPKEVVSVAKGSNEVVIDIEPTATSPVQRTFQG
ncbi:hypothetical protein BDD12DRAFT_887509 [Trichophaea hybrida]|nr:hypothetical protein BDD12DRAFT_887509 [Trichophaea hybrida]